MRLIVMNVLVKNERLLPRGCMWWSWTKWFVMSMIVIPWGIRLTRNLLNEEKGRIHKHKDIWLHTESIGLYYVLKVRSKGKNRRVVANVDCALSLFLYHWGNPVSYCRVDWMTLKLCVQHLDRVLSAVNIFGSLYIVSPTLKRKNPQRCQGTLEF